MSTSADSAGSFAIAGRSTIGHAAFGALLGAMLVFPLYPKIGLLSVGGTYIPVRLDDIITAIAVATWVVSLFSEKRMPRAPRLGYALAAWVGIGLVSVLVGAGLQGTVPWSTALLYWAKPIEYLLLGWMAFDLVTTPSRLRRFLIVVLATAGVVVLIGLLQSANLVPAPPTYVPGSTYGVLTSTFGDAHQLATYLALIALVTVAVWPDAGLGWRAVGVVFLVALSYVLVHTGGRSEFIALLVVSIVLLRWAPLRPQSLVLLAALLVFLALPSFLPDRGPAPLAPAGAPVPTLVAGATAAPGSVDVGERIGGDLSQDVSLSLRLQLKWPRLLAIAWAHPILGGGPSAATEAADGYYVRSLVEIGVAGTIVFLLAILAVLQALWRTYDTTDGMVRRLALVMFVGTAFTAAVGVLIDTWVASRPMQLYWPLLGAVLATTTIALDVRPRPVKG